MERCDYCDGTGVLVDDRRGTERACAECHGTGSVRPFVPTRTWAEAMKARNALLATLVAESLRGAA